MAAGLTAIFGVRNHRDDLCRVGGIALGCATLWPDTGQDAGGAAADSGMTACSGAKKIRSVIVTG